MLSVYCYIYIIFNKNILLFHKIMHNFIIEFNFVKHFFKSNLYFDWTWWQCDKRDIFFINITFNIQRHVLRTQRFDKKIILISPHLNSGYHFAPLFILTHNPFNWLLNYKLYKLLFDSYIRLHIHREFLLCSWF